VDDEGHEPELPLRRVDTSDDRRFSAVDVMNRDARPPREGLRSDLARRQNRPDVSIRPHDAGRPERRRSDREQHTRGEEHCRTRPAAPSEPGSQSRSDEKRPRSVAHICLLSILLIWYVTCHVTGVPSSILIPNGKFTQLQYVKPGPQGDP
jgi:hypothetical protein